VLDDPRARGEPKIPISARLSDIRREVLRVEC
jgi:hypothetical protein